MFFPAHAVNDKIIVSMKKCYICKFPHEEFYKCKIDENFNFYDVCINCAKFEALNNKNFKLLDENHNTKNL